MAQSASARKVAAPIFPRQVEAGTLLKLTSRDSDNFVIVKVLQEFRLVRIFFKVLAFDSAEICTLDVADQRLDRGADGPKEYFLRADIATPKEVATYITSRHDELKQTLVGAARALGHFERTIQSKYSPNVR